MTLGKTPELGESKSAECDILSLQCSDTVRWATGRASGLCWYVVGDDLTGALNVIIAPVVTTTSIILALIKSRMETF